MSTSSASRRIALRDSTLREGMDVAGVDFSHAQRLRIAAALSQAGIKEIECVAPARVFDDLEFARLLKKKKIRIKASGLIYANSARAGQEIKKAASCLDRFDILMPLSPKRKPYVFKEKISMLKKILSQALHMHDDVGAGFPHSTQVGHGLVMRMCIEAEKAGVKRITIYDTNGSVDPFSAYALIRKIKTGIRTPVFFHAHNDLGLAVANSLAAAAVGVDGLDVTVNGLGDRAGNAALEQVVLNLGMSGFETGVKLKSLMDLSRGVGKESRLGVWPLAPVVGRYAFLHKSGGHFENLKLFEAFDPGSAGLCRKKIRR